MPVLASILPGLRGTRVEAIRLGLRAEPADGMPVLGPAPEVAGLYHAVSRSGITLCAVFGRIVARDLATGADGDALPYRPSDARWLRQLVRFSQAESNRRRGT